jgi:hypothetical protein
MQAAQEGYCLSHFLLSMLHLTQEIVDCRLEVSVILLEYDINSLMRRSGWFYNQRKAEKRNTEAEHAK